ncbi:MAG: group II truncated hemoglobin [Myxococcales bacterium]|nr:group II truncated hemoglobin [Myxococcales bacterium]
MAWTPTPQDTPFHRLGEVGARELAKRFYDHMDASEPALVAIHETDGAKVSAGTRERFTLFLVEWLGGPPIYSPVHGHPRLRMRHAKVAIGTDMRDAWLRCMNAALVDVVPDDGVREYLAARFAEVADFMRNREGT